MKSLYAILIGACCLPCFVGAQQSVSGIISDTHGEPLHYAAVLLVTAGDSALVRGGIADETGRYVFKDIQPGDYTISAGMVGYETAWTAGFSILQGTDLALPPIVLPEGAMLDEVWVVGQKPLFEKQVDRMIINVQSNSTHAGNSVLEVLAKSPGISVNQQGISMSGKAGVRVMINGKLNRMPMDVAVQMLSGMSAAQVEKIELISSPSAKYEAEGNAGIIHIVTAESPDRGTSGTAGASTGYNTGPTWDTHAHLSHRGKSFNAVLSYSIRYDKNRHNWDNYHEQSVGEFLQVTNSESRRHPVTVVQNFQGGFEFNLSDKTTVTTLLTGYERRWDMKADTYVTSIRPPDAAVYTDMDIVELNLWKSASGSIGLRHQFNPQRQLGVTYDYLYYHNHNPSRYDNRISVDNDDHYHEKIEVEKRTPVHFHVFSMDYSGSIKSGLTMEAGAKTSFSQFTNGVRVRHGGDRHLTIVPEFSNTAYMDETILAAYGSWSWKPGRVWNLDGGLRYEHTHTLISTKEEGEAVDRNYGNWFPNLRTSYRISQTNSIQLAYGRRITRPTYNEMAPFVFFMAPTSFVDGNISLMPALVHAVDFGFQHKNTWLTLKYSHTKDDIAPFQPQEDPENLYQILRSENLASMRAYGINFNFPLVITPWWEVQSDLSFYRYRYMTRHLEANRERQVNSLLLGNSHSFSLPRDYSVTLAGKYESGVIWGLNQIEPMWRVDLGVSKRFAHGGSLTLSGNDLFYTYIWKINAGTGYSRSFLFFNQPERSVSITYSFRFGNNQLKSINISSRAETEKQRIK
ncbi:TonB-dependent receptor domain-containing protein [Negadavirga shengliensis]|uniref:TonB-dependent receptor domain-containing protein n=1 Tax=Negadavirga shengliensis TaxID=1389218 RepID=A0ABV9T7Q0_9BACT